MRQNGVRSPVRFPYGQGMKKVAKLRSKDTLIEKMNPLQ